MAASNTLPTRLRSVAESVRHTTARAAGAATSAAHRAQTAAAKALHNHVIGPMEKGFAAAKLETPPAGVIDGVDLRVLPKFVCYKAALLRERLSLQYVLALVVGVFLAYFVVSRVEVAGLSSKLREKEYILAPGVQDFIAVSPQSVPASHIQNAAMEFLQTFGNLNAVNIDEQYARLAESMSQDLRVQFDLEAGPWRAKVKEDGIAQILSVTDKEIRATNDGYKKEAAARGVPYQILMRMFIIEGFQRMKKAG